MGLDPDELVALERGREQPRVGNMGFTVWYSVLVTSPLNLGPHSAP